MLLVHYMLKSLKHMNKLPENAAVIKTILTIEGVRKKFKNFNNWVKKWTWLFITLAVILIIALLVVIALKVI